MKCFVFLSRSHSGDQICLLKIISVQWLLFEFLILCDVCNFALVYSISVTDKDMNRFPYLLELAYCFCNFQNIFSIASLTISSHPFKNLWFFPWFTICIVISDHNNRIFPEFFRRWIFNIWKDLGAPSPPSFAPRILFSYPSKKSWHFQRMF